MWRFDGEKTLLEQKVGSEDVLWLAVLTNAISGLTVTLFPRAVGGLEVRCVAGVGSAHAFLRNLLFTCLTSHLFGKNTHLELQMPPASCSPPSSCSETLLLHRAVSARLHTQMSCEVILTRRDGKGNEFFRPARHAITPRLALVCIASTLFTAQHRIPSM